MNRTSDCGPGRGIELIYSRDCPNVGLARRRLGEALDILGRERAWTEWERESPAAPDYARRLGSPTILVDGQDVMAGPPSDADSCRVYPSVEGFEGAPTIPTLVEALRGGGKEPRP